MKKTYQYQIKFLATSAIYGVLAVSGANADTASNERAILEEVTVTAMKRGEQSLQEVPDSISVLTAQMLENFAIEGFADLSARVAGLDVQDQGPGDKRYIIRGINSAGEAQTAVYYDNIPMTGIGGVASNFGGRQPDLMIFDVEQVAVLRGPQGTLYGSNSQSGVVHIVTKKPVLNEFEGQGSLDLSSTTEGGGENFSLKAAANIPVIEDRLAFRVLGYSTDYSGFIDNTALGVEDVDDYENKGARVSAKLALNEETILLGQFFYQDMYSGGQPQHRPYDAVIGSNVFPAAGERNSSLATLEPFADKIKIYALTLEHDFNWADMTVAGSYFDRDILHMEDISTSFRFFEYLQGLGAFPVFDVPEAGLSVSPQSSKLLTLETRLNTILDGPLNGLVGIYYSKRDNDFATSAKVADPDTGKVDETLDPVSERNFQNDTKEIALFAEATYDITEDWSVMGGVRWFETKRALNATTVVPFFGLGSPGVEPEQSSKNNDFIFKFQTSYHITEDNLVYFQYAQGYRAGGTNASTVAVVPSQYEPDRTENFEIGTKNKFLEGAATVNIAAYRVTLKELQANMTFGPGGAFSGTGNIADDVARSTGIEADISWRIDDYLSVNISTNYNDVKLLKDVPDLGAEAVEGAPLQNVPEFTYSMSAEYYRAISDRFTGFLRASWQHTGSVEITRFDNFNLPLDSYNIVNLRAGVEDSNYSLTFYVNNAFDEAAELNALNNVNEPMNIITNRPRTIGLILDVKF